jgi:hypothetical protein
VCVQHALLVCTVWRQPHTPRSAQLLAACLTACAHACLPACLPVCPSVPLFVPTLPVPAVAKAQRAQIAGLHRRSLVTLQKLAVTRVTVRDRGKHRHSGTGRWVVPRPPACARVHMQGNAERSAAATHHARVTQPQITLTCSTPAHTCVQVVGRSRQAQKGRVPALELVTPSAQSRSIASTGPKSFRCSCTSSTVGKSTRTHAGPGWRTYQSAGCSSTVAAGVCLGSV